ncbi:MAG: hypothetical protein EWM73_03521 [Nitrospira sp.]|nr:MAG: hypothetical protein EWM73_03521 [Nitrospira sp.]
MQPDIMQGVELPLDEGDMLEELHGIVHRHIQHVGDALPLMVNLHRLAVVPLALANLTGHVDVRQEMHLDLDQPVALAGLAAAALYIETIATGLVPPNAGLGQIRVEIPDETEQTCIGRRIRARSPADRGLVDVDHFIQRVDTQQFLAAIDLWFFVIEQLGEGME